MIVVVVPDANVYPDQLDYPGGVYTYKGCEVKEAFRQFTLKFIDILDMLYASDGRKLICELPNDCNHWKPNITLSWLYDQKGYLKIPTPSDCILYTVYVYSDAMDCLYPWKVWGFDEIFNKIIKEEHVDRYMCQIFSSGDAVETTTLYAKDVSDFRAQLDMRYNPYDLLKHVSTSDKSNTSFGELFYNEDNRLVYAIMAEKKNN